MANCSTIGAISIIDGNVNFVHVANAENCVSRTTPTGNLLQSRLKILFCILVIQPSSTINGTIHEC
jgi:hypothetical protein